MSAKFHGHYMTKLNKQMKLEKEVLEKEKSDLVRYLVLNIPLIQKICLGLIS